MQYQQPFLVLFFAKIPVKEFLLFKGNGRVAHCIGGKSKQQTASSNKPAKALIRHTTICDVARHSKYMLVGVHKYLETT